MEPSPDVLERGFGLFMQLVEQFGILSALGLMIMGFFGWMMVKIVNQLLTVMPKIELKLQELVTADNGLRSDVKEALQALRNYQQGQQSQTWHERYGQGERPRRREDYER